MKSIYKQIMRKATWVAMAWGAFAAASCETDLDNGIYQVESSPMIGEFIAGNESLKDFYTMLKKADLVGMSDAYGTYTCFAPTNEAVQHYLAEAGLHLDSLTEEQATNMVLYHFVSDTLATSDFNETRLDAVNMAKQYISTKTEMDSLENVIVRVNRTATIIDGNNRLGNGYVHIVDGFLSRPTATLEETIAEMPDESFSMMKQLLAEIQQKYGEDIRVSSYITTDTTYVTFLAQTNEAFEKLEIYNLDSLLVRLRKNDLQGVLTDTELVSNWLGYHCLKGRIYMKDILEASSLTTQVESQVVTVTSVVDTIYLNRFKTEHIDEDGIRLDRQGYYVDYACHDGVVQTIFDELEIIERSAYRVYWDMADQPEIRALKGYRKGGTSQTFQIGELSMMNWGGKLNPAITYDCYGLPEVNGSYDVKSQYIYNDCLNFRLCINVMQWLEIKMPVLVAGKYKIWLCWRRYNPCKFRTTLIQEGEDDQILPSNVSLEDYMLTGDEDVMEAQGWKQYTAKALNSVMCCKNLGIVEIKKTGSHTLRFDALVQSKGAGVPWDMIQFIPTDQDQVWPRVAMDGSLVYEGTPDCQIFPDDGTNCVEEGEEEAL